MDEYEQEPEHDCYANKFAYPTLNTLFVGNEESSGYFTEVCMQWGELYSGTNCSMCPLLKEKGLNLAEEAQRLSLGNNSSEPCKRQRKRGQIERANY